MLYSFPSSVSSMAVHPTSPYYMAFGLGDGSVQVLDRRMISDQQQGSLSGSAHPAGAVRRKYAIGNQARKITSVQFNRNGSELLASYSEDFVYLFSSRQLGFGSGESEILKPAYLSRCESYSPAVPARRKRRSKAGGHVGLQSAGEASPQGVRSNNAKPPTKKKLRLRGDWSDTGPEACPEVDGSESAGRTLMSHMSNMFSQWIDMSLSSDEQEQEGGVFGRARQRLNARRREREGEQRGEASRSRLEELPEGGEGDVRERLASSSSSDDSFNLFDEQEQEIGESGASNVSAEAASQEEGGGRRGDRESVVSKCPSLRTRSGGECSVNEPTAEIRVAPNSAHHSNEGKCTLEWDFGAGMVPNSAHHGKGEAEKCGANRELATDSAHHGNEGACSVECVNFGAGMIPNSAHHIQGGLDCYESGDSGTPDGAHQSTEKALKCESDSTPLTSRKKRTLHSDEVPGSMQHSLSPTSLESGHSCDSAVLVENRTINFGSVPAINVIEDETDSDDDWSGISRDVVKGATAGSGDLKLRGSGETDEGEGRFGGRDCMRPFMVYKGHRNARTMVCNHRISN